MNIYDILWPLSCRILGLPFLILQHVPRPFGLLAGHHLQDGLQGGPREVLQSKLR